MKEQISYDKHNTSKKQIQDLCTLIRSFSAYVHSLDVRQKTSRRLYRLCSQMVPEQALPRPQRKGSSLETLSSKIKDVLHKCYTNIELPPNYYIDCNEYSEKYKEHSEATMNYYYLLQKEALSPPEMRDLDVEYDKVTELFRESKKSISNQLDCLISQRSDVIQTCVEDLLPLLKEIMRQDRDIYRILQAFSIEALSGSSENVVSPKSLLNKSSKPARRLSGSSTRCRNAPRGCSCFEEDYENDY